MDEGKGSGFFFAPFLVKTVNTLYACAHKTGLSVMVLGDMEISGAGYRLGVRGGKRKEAGRGCGGFGDGKSYDMANDHLQWSQRSYHGIGLVGRENA